MECLSPPQFCNIVNSCDSKEFASKHEILVISLRKIASDEKNNNLLRNDKLFRESCWKFASFILDNFHILKEKSNDIFLQSMSVLIIIASLYKKLPDTSNSVLIVSDLIEKLSNQELKNDILPIFSTFFLMPNFILSFFFHEQLSATLMKIFMEKKNYISIGIFFQLFRTTIFFTPDNINLQRSVLILNEFVQGIRSDCEDLAFFLSNCSNFVSLYVQKISKIDLSIVNKAIQMNVNSAFFTALIKTTNIKSKEITQFLMNLLKSDDYDHLIPNTTFAQYFLTTIKNPVFPLNVKLILVEMLNELILDSTVNIEKLNSILNIPNLITSDIFPDDLNEKLNEIFSSLISKNYLNQTAILLKFLKMKSPRFDLISINLNELIEKQRILYNDKELVKQLSVFFLEFDSDEKLGNFFGKYSSFRLLFSRVFQEAYEYRVLLLSKIMPTKDYFSPENTFIDLISALITMDGIDAQVLTTYFSKLHTIFTQEIFQSTISIFSQNNYLSSLFLEFDGLALIEPFFENELFSDDLLSDFILALTQKKFNEKLNVLILNLNENHRLFKMEKKYYEKLLLDEDKIEPIWLPVLIPFLNIDDDEKDKKNLMGRTNSQFDLVNLGRFALPMYNKLGVKKKIPNLSAISNRYLLPEKVHAMMNDTSEMDNFVDPKCDHFPLFEFMKKKLGSTIEFKSTFFGIAFWFKFLTNQENVNFSIFSTSSVDISLENDNSEVDYNDIKNSNYSDNSNNLSIKSDNVNESDIGHEISANIETDLSVFNDYDKVYDLNEVHDLNKTNDLKNVNDLSKDSDLNIIVESTNEINNPISLVNKNTENNKEFDSKEIITSNKISKENPNLNEAERKYRICVKWGKSIKIINDIKPNIWHFAFIGSSGWMFSESVNLIIDKESFIFPESKPFYTSGKFGRDDIENTNYFLSPNIRLFTSVFQNNNFISQLLKKGPGYLQSSDDSLFLGPHLPEFKMGNNVILVPYQGFQQFLKIPFFANDFFHLMSTTNDRKILSKLLEILLLSYEINMFKIPKMWYFLFHTLKKLNHILDEDHLEKILDFIFNKLPENDKIDVLRSFLIDIELWQMISFENAKILFFLINNYMSDQLNYVKQLFEHDFLQFSLAIVSTIFSGNDKENISVMMTCFLIQICIDNELMFEIITSLNSLFFLPSCSPSYDNNSSMFSSLQRIKILELLLQNVDKINYNIFEQPLVSYICIKGCQEEIILLLRIFTEMKKKEGDTLPKYEFPLNISTIINNFECWIYLLSFLYLTGINENQIRSILNFNENCDEQTTFINQLFFLNCKPPPIKNYDALKPVIMLLYVSLASLLYSKWTNQSEKLPQMFPEIISDMFSIILAVNLNEVDINESIVCFSPILTLFANWEIIELMKTTKIVSSFNNNYNSHTYKKIIRNISKGWNIDNELKLDIVKYLKIEEGAKIAIDKKRKSIYLIHEIQNCFESLRLNIKNDSTASFDFSATSSLLEKFGYFDFVCGILLFEIKSQRINYLDMICKSALMNNLFSGLKAQPQILIIKDFLLFFLNRIEIMLNSSFDNFENNNTKNDNVENDKETNSTSGNFITSLMHIILFCVKRINILSKSLTDAVLNIISIIITHSNRKSQVITNVRYLLLIILGKCNFNEIEISCIDLLFNPIIVQKDFINIIFVLSFLKLPSKISMKIYDEIVMGPNSNNNLKNLYNKYFVSFIKKLNLKEKQITDIYSKIKEESTVNLISLLGDLNNIFGKEYEKLFKIFKNQNKKGSGKKSFSPVTTLFKTKKELKVNESEAGMENFCSIFEDFLNYNKVYHYLNMNWLLFAKKEIKGIIFPFLCKIITFTVSVSFRKCESFSTVVWSAGISTFLSDPLNFTKNKNSSGLRISPLCWPLHAPRILSPIIFHNDINDVEDSYYSPIIMVDKNNNRKSKIILNRSKFIDLIPINKVDDINENYYYGDINELNKNNLNHFDDNNNIGSFVKLPVDDFSNPLYFENIISNDSSIHFHSFIRRFYKFGEFIFCFNTIFKRFTQKIRSVVFVFTPGIFILNNAYVQSATGIKTSSEESNSISFDYFDSKNLRLSFLNYCNENDEYSEFLISLFHGEYGQDFTFFCGHPVIILNPYEILLTSRNEKIFHIVPQNFAAFSLENVPIKFDKLFLPLKLQSSFSPTTNFLFVDLSITNLEKKWSNGKINNFEFVLSLNYLDNRFTSEIFRCPIFPPMYTEGVIGFKKNIYPFLYSRDLHRSSLYSHFLIPEVFTGEDPHRTVIQNFEEINFSDYPISNWILSSFPSLFNKFSSNTFSKNITSSSSVASDLYSSSSSSHYSNSSSSSSSLSNKKAIYNLMKINNNKSNKQKILFKRKKKNLNRNAYDNKNSSFNNISLKSWIDDSNKLKQIICDKFIIKILANSMALIIKIIEDDTEIVIMDSNFIAATSLSSSKDGNYFVVDFDFGISSVYRLLYENGRPKQILKLHDYVLIDGRKKLKSVSIINGYDFLVATICGKNVILWDCIRGYTHRVIDFYNESEILGVLFDEGVGWLWCYSPSTLYLYSINGSLLFKINPPDGISFCFGAFDRTITILSKDNTERVAFYGMSSNSLMIRTVEKK